MTSVIVGISGYDHDAAAAVLVDGQLRAAAEEERFTRVKHQSGLAHKALEYCLQEAGVRLQDVTHVAVDLDWDVAYSSRLAYWEKVSAKHPQAEEIRADEMGGLLKRRSDAVRLSQACGAALQWVPHHLAHAFSASHAHGVRRAAVLVADYLGEFGSTWGGAINNGSLEPAFAVDFPHSLGVFYAAATQHLGFETLSDEYKVMGLASYGTPRFASKMDELIELRPDGTFELDLDYFQFHETFGRTPYVSDLFVRTFGAPREPADAVTAYHADLAASVQATFTRAVLHAAQRLAAITAEPILCYSGGVALNCVANTALREAGLFKDVVVHPASHDAGAAVGACFAAYAKITGTPAHPLRGFYLGSAVTSREVEELLEGSGWEYTKLTGAALVDACATDLAAGNVVGWCQGRMEWGPRALGNRSILADPRRREMMDIVNERIKHREQFRPFAPSVLAEQASEYFDCKSSDTAMLFVAQATERAQRDAPAIIHVDGTSRVQVVHEEHNPLYWSLIGRFAEKTGVPLLLNTSFNVRGEPIVRTAANALACFATTGLDVLYIREYRVTKGGTRQ